MLRNSPRPWSLAVSAIVASWLVAASPASAQVQDVEPHWVTVVSDHVNLRCGDGVVWYPVLQVDRGTTLRVDGKGFKWLRVAYPAKAVAFVRAEEAEPTADGRSVRLTRPSRLIAANLHSGLDGSWKALLDRPLAPGAQLPLLGRVQDASGAVVAYRVRPPSEARAFISEDFVRPATQEEIARATGLAPDAAEKTQRAPTLAKAKRDAATGERTPPRPAQPAAPPQAEQASQPVPTIAAAPAQAAEPVTLEDVLSQYGQTPAQRAAQKTTEQAAKQAAEEAPRAQRSAAAAPEAAGRASVAAPAFDADRPLPTLQDLQEAFVQVMAQPVASAEIEPLIHEHERLLASLRGKPRQEAAVAHLQRQIALLRIKADLQRNMRRLEEAAERAALASSQIERKIASLESERLYPIRGRLVASALYDGKRLPLLYRLQSIDGPTPVTIAYVLPDHELDLAAKLGAVVGVEGEKTIDPDLGAPLIRPSRVEVLYRPGLEASVPDGDR